MIAEYREREQQLQLRKKRLVEEFTLMNEIININTLGAEGKTNPAAIMRVERLLAELDLDNVAASYTLDYWRTQWGENMIIPIVCEVMDYFLKQFEVKEKLTDTQLLQLAIKLIAAQPLLRVRELIFVLREALAGSYGPTYERVGINRILEWLNKFYQQSCEHLEQRMANQNKDEARGDTPWEVLERRMKAYHDEQMKKREICKKVWGSEDQKARVENYKQQIGLEKAVVTDDRKQMVENYKKNLGAK